MQRGKLCKIKCHLQAKCDVLSIRLRTALMEEEGDDASSAKAVTSLHLAAAANLTTVVKSLVEVWNASANARDQFGRQVIVL